MFQHIDGNDTIELSVRKSDIRFLIIMDRLAEKLGNLVIILA
jgi:hypothetical protein